MVAVRDCCMCGCLTNGGSSGWELFYTTETEKKMKHNCWSYCSGRHRSSLEKRNAKEETQLLKRVGVSPVVAAVAGGYLRLLKQKKRKKHSCWSCCSGHWSCRGHRRSSPEKKNAEQSREQKKNELLQEKKKEKWEKWEKLGFLIENLRNRRETEKNYLDTPPKSETESF
ncbi:hypothetical protein RJT34_16806 [Clitoria ternatea]|uniref:Uncharacterized protein n=1 Tax=Clitoria ternatea TaxID=43366 RepID=A0AAN9J9D7_CLITE